MRRGGGGAPRAVTAALLLVAQPALADGSATPPLPATEDERAAPCEAGYIERVYAATKPSVVRIRRSDGALGTGFVYHSPRHVATALHVVDLGRDLRVEFPGGATTAAAVVATDPAHDLAILELAEATDAPPLLPRFSVAIGSPLVAIGNPYGDLVRFSAELEGLLNFSISQGIVSAKSAAYVQTDALLSPGNSGGPMLSCDGRVIAIADRLLDARIGFGVPVLHLAELATKIGRPGSYRGRWTADGGAIGLTYQRDANGYLGFYLGGGLVGYDRIPLTIRLGVAFAGKGDTAAPITDRPIYRFWSEATAGYRWLFFPYAFPTYLTLAGGLFATVNRGSETRLGIDPARPGELVATRKTLQGGGIAPIADVSLRLLQVELSYGFALDPIHPNGSTHRVLVGLAF